jgi:beta-glucosidase-like glycosyl hydrolase
MHAAGFAAKLADRMRLSLEAGCDAVLVCDPQDVRALYRELDAGTPPAESLLAPLAGRNTLSEEELAMVGEWAHWQESLEALERSKWS